MGREFYISGKEWLTTDEAAHYAGVSPAQWRAHREDHGIFPTIFMGKMLFRKQDIDVAIESQRITA